MQCPSCTRGALTIRESGYDAIRFLASLPAGTARLDDKPAAETLLAALSPR